MMLSEKVNQGRLFLVIIDDELLGKTFEENQMQLKCSFDAHPATKEEIQEKITQASFIQGIGTNTTTFLQEKELMGEIKHVQGIPFGFVLR